MKLGDFLKHVRQQLMPLYLSPEIEGVMRIFIEDILKITPIQAIVEANVPLPTEKINTGEEALTKLLNGNPPQYVAGVAWFDGMQFKVGPSVLIPRQETEELVIWCNETLKVRTHIRVLELGTGSGCIPIALLNRNKSWICETWDFSEKAIELAQENAQQLLKYPERLTFKHRNALLEIPEGQWDVIISNPPYVVNPDDVSDKVIQFEPHMALFAPGNDPYLFYRRLHQWGSLPILKPGGWLFTEIEANRGSQVLSIFKEESWETREIGLDISQKERMIRLQKKL